MRIKFLALCLLLIVPVFPASKPLTIDLQDALARTFSQIGPPRSPENAGKCLHLTLLRYEAGKATALEVVDAETTVSQARAAYDDGLLRYRVALANLGNVTGVFLP